MDVETVGTLASPAGRELIRRAGALLDGGTELVTVAARLREGQDPGLAAAALTQARLRRRARAKAGDLADRLLWTGAGLEQATRRPVARHRATRFAELAPARLADLCCGVGMDLLELAAATGPAATLLGVDHDPLTVAVAAANVREMGLADRVAVEQGDVTATDLAGFDAAFVDPGRRSGGRRTFDPAAYSPPFSFVAELAGRVAATGAKVAPGLPHGLVPPGAEAEWVSDGGEVKEAALWFGPLAGLHGPASRRATLLPSGATVVDDPALPPPPVGPPGRWLHEPDGAVVRAGLVAEVAAALDGRLLDPAIAYVTTDSDARSPFTSRYEVLEALPFQLKRLRAALRARDARDVVVKKRGSALEPEQLRRQLRLDGDGPVLTVLLTLVGGRPLALIAAVVDRPGPTTPGPV